MSILTGKRLLQGGGRGAGQPRREHRAARQPGEAADSPAITRLSDWVVVTFHLSAVCLAKCQFQTEKCQFQTEK